MERSTWRSSRFAPVKEFPYPMYRRAGGPYSGHEHMETNLLLLQGSDTQLLGRLMGNLISELIEGWEYSRLPIIRINGILIFPDNQ
jgi:hypothetical protein